MGTFAFVILIILLALFATIICLLYILWLAYPPDPEPSDSAKVAPEKDYDTVPDEESNVGKDVVTLKPSKKALIREAPREKVVEVVNRSKNTNVGLMSTDEDAK